MTDHEQHIETEAKRRYHGPRDTVDVPWEELPETCRETWRAIAVVGLIAPEDVPCDS